MSAALRSLPSITPPLITRAGWSFANVRSPLAASTGSPSTKAMALGPTSHSSMPSTPASLAARRVRVFFTTAYVVVWPRLPRNCLSCETVSPRYSVSTVADELRNNSEISVTAACLSGRAMGFLPAVRRNDREPRRTGPGSREQHLRRDYAWISGDRRSLVLCQCTWAAVRAFTGGARQKRGRRCWAQSPPKPPNNVTLKQANTDTPLGEHREKGSAGGGRARQRRGRRCWAQSPPKPPNNVTLKQANTDTPLGEHREKGSAGGGKHRPSARGTPRQAQTGPDRDNETPGLDRGFRVEIRPRDLGSGQPGYPGPSSWKPRSS